MIKTKNYVAKDIYWDANAYKLYTEHQEIELSLSQKKALAFLLTHANKAVKNIDIFYEIDSSLEREFSERSVRNIISLLRKKIPNIEIKNSYGGFYTLVTPKEEKSDFKKHLFEILEQSKNAIAITDPNQYDNPIIYVNAAFLELFGYKREELIGNNIRLLNADDKEQQGLKEIKKAIEAQKFIEVNIREYTKEGERIYDDITISPIFDKQRKKLIYFLSVHKDLSKAERLLEKLRPII